jgi:hypothetical protein|tara:strand:+ start:354 stop:533 length:180 start_codon:yes stop_codon:yes gene_type:complete
MNKGKLKVLVMALKEIVEELESEIYSDIKSCTEPPKDDEVPTFSSLPLDFDESYEDVGC